jgi:tRNA threonylcarbamoyladenosine biosynthesis protein TsaE
MKFISNSPSQTKNFAKKIAKILISRKNSPKILALKGNLGAGKTTFLKGFAKALGIKEKIISPTFIIMRKHTFLNKKSKSKNYFYHFDCYRIQSEKEILNLGFKEIVSDPKNIAAIEWAEKIKKFLPKKTFWLEFKILDKKKREILFKNGK